MKHDKYELEPFNYFTDYLERYCYPKNGIYLPLNERSFTIAKNVNYKLYTLNNPSPNILLNPSLLGNPITSWSELEVDGGIVNPLNPNVEINGLVGTAGIVQNTLTIGLSYIFYVNIVSSSGIGSSRIKIGGLNNNFFFPSGTGRFFGYLFCDSPAFLLLSNGSCNFICSGLSGHIVGDFDGVYVGTLLNSNFFMRQSVPTFDGINDYIQLNSRIESLFNPDEGTIILVIRPNDWNNSNVYSIVNIGVNADNQIQITKENVAYRLGLRVVIGGVSSQINYDISSLDSSKYHLIVASWNRSNNRIRLFNKKSVVSAAYPLAGTWTVSNITETFSRIGVNGSGTNYYPGRLAHFALVNSEIPLEQQIKLYNAFKITSRSNGA